MSILFLGVLTSLFKGDNVVGKTFEFSPWADWMLWEVGAEKESAMPQIYAGHTGVMPVTERGMGYDWAEAAGRPRGSLTSVLGHDRALEPSSPLNCPVHADTTGLSNHCAAQTPSGDCPKNRVALKAEVNSEAPTASGFQLTHILCSWAACHFFLGEFECSCLCLTQFPLWVFSVSSFWFVFSRLLHSNTNTRMQWIYDKVW